MSACNTSVKSKEHLSEIYIVALDAIMNQNEALSEDMAFIAIDMSNFHKLNEDHKNEILNFFKHKYKIDVMDATYDTLKEKGLFNPDTLTLDGVLLGLEKIEFKFNNHVFFEGYKHRSGTGAVGVEVTVHYKKSDWVAKEIQMTWIS